MHSIVAMITAKGVIIKSIAYLDHPVGDLSVPVVGTPVVEREVVVADTWNAHPSRMVFAVSVV